MSQDNQITLRGYVTAEPKYWKTTPTQTPVAEIRVGSTPRRLNRATGEWLDGDTSYYTVKCWRRLAVNVAGCLRKGDMVLIRGKVVTRTWVDDEQRPRTQVQVEADSVGHDLSFGWSHFIRGVQSQPNAAQRLADGEMSRQYAPDEQDADGEPGGYDSGEYDSGHGEPGGGAEDDDDQVGPAAAGAVIDALASDLGEPLEVASVF